MAGEGLLRPPAAGHERGRRHRRPRSRRSRLLPGAVRMDPGRGPTPGPGGRRPSPVTWGAPPSSTRPWPGSPQLYADQTERDHASLVEAVWSGRIEAPGRVKSDRDHRVMAGPPRRAAEVTACRRWRAGLGRGPSRHRRRWPLPGPGWWRRR